MRLLILVVLLVGLGASSCEKYKLKQPAYLNFRWDFFGQQSGVQQPVITGGYFYLKSFKVFGSRAAGPDVEIEQELPLMKTIFSAGGNLGLTMDVPVGEYNEFNVSLKVVEEEVPCMVLTGYYDFGGGNLVPFKIEWGAGKDLNFHPETSFTLDKKENYKAIIGVNIEKLFSITLPVDWAEAQQTMENDVLTIVINKNHNNTKIFDDVDAKLEESLLLKVE
jgi:hypothetical protein